MDVDYIIVGQGLAGSAMAMALLQRGRKVLVLDREDTNSASRVAAGLVTTVAGKGMNPGWRQAEYLPQAMAYYRKLEAEYGVKLFHAKEVLRLFDDEKQKAKFERKFEQIEDWVADLTGGVSSEWNADAGGFKMLHGGWLDTNAYMRVVRAALGEGGYRKCDFSFDDVDLLEGGVCWNGVKAKRVILCQGISGLEGSPFSHPVHRSAKGEMLKVKIPNADQSKIINRNGWMVPLGDETWRVGATYKWEDMQGQTTDEGRRAVREKLENFTSLPYEVLEHSAGVRPIMRKSQPYVGVHPEHHQLGFFNGLGSKGVITAPSVAEHFSDYLEGNIDELDPELILPVV